MHKQNLAKGLLPHTAPQRDGIDATSPGPMSPGTVLTPSARLYPCSPEHRDPSTHTHTHTHAHLHNSGKRLTPCPPRRPLSTPNHFHICSLPVKLPSLFREAEQKEVLIGCHRHLLTLCQNVPGGHSLVRAHSGPWVPVVWQEPNCTGSRAGPRLLLWTPEHSAPRPPLQDALHPRQVQDHSGY